MNSVWRKIQAIFTGLVFPYLQQNFKFLTIVLDGYRKKCEKQDDSVDPDQVQISDMMLVNDV